MVHRPRRALTRLAGLSLSGVVVTALLLGLAGPLAAPGTPAASAAQDLPPAGVDIDGEALPVYQALAELRAAEGLPALAVHDRLVDSAERDACAMARGELQLTGSEQRLAEAGGQRENVGLVVDTDPDSGAQTMHDWWSSTPEHRADRMDPAMRHYGIGACRDQDRTYYVERFAS